MDVVKVRTCKGSNSIEIQMDWQYEDEKHCSIIAMPLEYFRKEDMWSIVRMLLDAAENQSKKKEKSVEWISVNDRLPEWEIPPKDVLVYHDLGCGMFIDRAWYSYDKHTWMSALGTRLKVTHWMPLPQPPKEDA